MSNLMTLVRRLWARLTGGLDPDSLESFVFDEPEPPEDQRWFLPNPPPLGSRFIIQSRTHDQDIAGEIDLGDGVWSDLVIPTTYDGDGVSLTSIAHPRRPWWSPRRWWEEGRDWFSNYGGDDE